MSQSAKLNKFDKLYTKFLYEWTDGKDLSTIIDDLKNTQFQEIPTAQMQIKEQNDDIQNVNQQNINQEQIKKCFDQQFPCFLIKKCQNKFPVDDDMEIPAEIINEFWNTYKTQILQSLLNISSELIAIKLAEEFIKLFGNQNEYNGDVFNSAALKLVQLME